MSDSAPRERTCGSLAYAVPTAATRGSDARIIFWFILLTLVYFTFIALTFDVLPFFWVGDAGRDLYTFELMSKGLWPARTSWWQYGPLMPLYYGSWFQLIGTNMLSANLALAFIAFSCAAISYVGLCLFVSPPIAFLACLTYLRLDIQHSFNHVGFFPFLLLSIYCLWKFFITAKRSWIYVGAIAVSMVALVKITAGITTFLAYIISLVMFIAVFRYDEVANRKHLGIKDFFALILLFTSLVATGYSFMYAGVSWEWIGECLGLHPSWRGYRAPFLSSLFTLPQLLFFARGQPLRWSILIFFTTIGLIGLKKRQVTASNQRNVLVSLASLFLFALFNCSDYFIDGRMQRIDFMVFPLQVLAGGLLLGSFVLVFPRLLQFVLLSLFCIATLWRPAHAIANARAFRTPERYLDFPRGKVYLGGNFSEARVIKKTTEFIINNTSKGQGILAINYDSGYYFLTDRRNIVRELMFNATISQSRQMDIIDEIRKGDVPIVLISSLANTATERFGLTYCRELAIFLNKNYDEIKKFGPWWPNSLYHNYHATRIMLRREH